MIATQLQTFATNNLTLTSVVFECAITAGIGLGAII